MLSNIFEAHREAKVVDFHLAQVAVLLELVLGVQVVVAVRADTVDLVAVKYANMQYAKYANRQYAKYANMQYIKFANMQAAVDLGAVKYVKYANMQFAKYARRSGSCRWEGNMFLALFAIKTI